MPGSGVVNISAKYSQALKGSSVTPIAAAEVWGGEVLLARFQMEASSSLTVDRNNAMRRTISVVLTEGVAFDPLGNIVPVVPRGPNGIFTPYGNELVTYSGLAYPDGTQELIQDGVFGIGENDMDGSGADLVVTLLASDRGAAFQRAGFADLWPVTPGVDLGGEIQRMLSSLPVGFTPTFNFAPTGFLTPAAPPIFKPGDDPWAGAIQMATDAGCELFPDPTGVITLLPVPNPVGSPTAWTYAEGLGNLATEIVRSLSRKTAFNYVIATGSGSGVAVPIQSQSPHGIDLNSASSTFVGGKYGRQVLNYTSPNINVQAQADTVADAQLLLSLGSIEAITLTAFPKPDHDVDDVISVTHTPTGIAAGLYVMDGYTKGYGSGGKLVAGCRSIAAFPQPS